MNALASLPAGVDETLDLVERFDEALLHGFARLGEAHREQLDELAGVFAGSPLGPVVAEAVAAVGRSEFVARYFLALSAARVALLGAAHGALVAQAREALGAPSSSPSPAGPEPPPLPPGSSATVLASVQQWLTELAIAGLKHLEETAVAPFAATLENLQADPELTGLAALLTGFSNELLRSMPAARQPAVPSFRWGDLWSAAMVRTQHLPGPPTFRAAEGLLTPLGLDFQSHENFACAVLYGVFDDGDGAAQTVRVPFAGYKVDVVAGAEVWDLFEPFDEPVLGALEGHKTLRVTRAELRADGDLILGAPPEVGDAADPFAAAGRLTALPSPAPLLRHPVHIAEPVCLPGGHGLPLAMERLGAGTELTEKAVGEAAELLGLLRFDRGGWRVQPLCVRLKKGFVMSGEDLAGARRKLKHRSLEVLKERAGRLLRSKA
jgi:hypothetical protein